MPLVTSALALVSLHKTQDVIKNKQNFIHFRLRLLTNKDTTITVLQQRLTNHKGQWLWLLETDNVTPAIFTNNFYWSSGNNFSVTKKGWDKKKLCLQLATRQHNHPSYTQSTKTHWSGWHHTYLHHFALSNPTCALGKSLKTWSETISFTMITKKNTWKKELWRCGSLNICITLGTVIRTLSFAEMSAGVGRGHWCHQALDTTWR